jgi:hypothetical protein
MDRNTVSIIQGLRVISTILFYDKNESRGMNTCITDYLASNAEIIKKGLDALKQLPLEEREKLYKTYNPFYTIAFKESRWYEDSLSTINRAIKRQSFDPQNKSSLWIYSFVEIEDMVRVLELVKYVVNTSEHSLSKHPVINYLPSTLVERFKDKL